MATNALAVDTKKIEVKLATLKERAESIVVSDAESYALACQVALDGRAEVKAIGFVLDPGIQSAKQHLERLRNQKQDYVGRITPIIAIVEQKAERWKGEERRKAAAEEERINAERRAEAARVAAAERAEAERKSEEMRKQQEREAEADRKAREKVLEQQRKAGEINKREAEKQKKLAAEQAEREKKLAAEEAERARLAAIEAEKVAAANVQEVRVEPSVPKVSGIKARVNWKFKIVNASKLPRMYLMADEVAIGTEVRRLKDKAKAEAAIPGIEVYCEDGI
jgi:hypothetical protein